MADPIDRQKAIETARIMCERCTTGDIIDLRDLICESLAVLPTVDAVPVIRCKDCVHYKGHWYCETWNNSPGFPAVTEDGFCNMAERRTDVTLN